MSIRVELNLDRLTPKVEAELAAQAAAIKARRQTEQPQPLEEG